MEAVNILLMVMLGFSGLIVLLLGYQIKQNQAVACISLPHLAIEKIEDKAGFSSFVGNRTIMIGLSLLMAAIISGVVPQFLMLTILLLILLVAALSLEFVINCKRYF